MDVVRLVGMEVRRWTDKGTGELKEFVGLHVVYEKYEDENMEGKKAENFSCPREVKAAELQIGKCYELSYTHFKTKNGMGARISGLTLVPEVK